MQFVILTGMSGAGKSTAMKMMEDIGFYCVDNLPIPLLKSFWELVSQGTNNELEKVAVGIDLRNGQPITELLDYQKRAVEMGSPMEILFLDAEDEVLIKRYKETRRNHPLSGEARVEEGIRLERELLKELRSRADYILDTSQLLTRELKEELNRIFVDRRDYHNIYVTILSFGYKFGIPADSDLVFDVRFLPNPYYVEGLRDKTGLDKEIRDFVMQVEEAGQFMDQLERMLNFLIPHYISEGKSQLVVSIGCTGGKHRSVTIAEELYQRLLKDRKFGLKVEHRDIVRK
ncbi:MAG: RNase adapter RapZ [Lachnospiraceae bacterium]|nr:RNase adapter RapZ [Lachnospiraceae bacterium]